MIKNIIFDLGNVVLEFDPEKLANQFTKIKEEQELLIEVIFKSKEWLELDNGTLEYDEAIRIFKSKLPNNLKKIAVLVMEDWMKFLNLQKNIIDVIKNLRENGYKTYILSNAPLSIEEYLINSELLNYFDGRIISAIEKVSKPHKEIYNRLFTKFNLNPEECFFIDDKEENIIAAKACGMNGYVHNMKEFNNIFRAFDENGINYN